MADTSSNTPFWPQVRARISWAWMASAAILLAVAVLDTPQFWPSVTFAARALLNTAPFILFAVLAVAYLKAKKLLPETFIPLDTIRGPLLRENSKQLLTPRPASLGFVPGPTCAADCVPTVQFLHALDLDRSSARVWVHREQTKRLRRN